MLETGNKILGEDSASYEEVDIIFIQQCCKLTENVSCTIFKIILNGTNVFVLAWNFFPKEISDVIVPMSHIRKCEPIMESLLAACDVVFDYQGVGKKMVIKVLTQQSLPFRSRCQYLRLDDWSYSIHWYVMKWRHGYQCWKKQLYLECLV